MFVQINGGASSAVVWPDAIPTLIPQVDVLVVQRHELAPRRLFKRQDDTCVVPFDRALNLLESFASSDYSIPAFLLSYKRAPGNLSAFVKDLSPHRGEMKAVPMDQILNREFVNNYRKG